MSILIEYRLKTDADDAWQARPPSVDDGPTAVREAKDFWSALNERHGRGAFEIRLWSTTHDRRFGFIDDEGSFWRSFSRDKPPTPKPKPH